MALLARERTGCSFDAAALLASVAGRRPKQNAEFKPLFANEVFDESLDDYASYPDLAKKKIQRVAAAFDITRNNPAFHVRHMSQRVSMGDMFELNGVFVHFTMSLTFIKTQGSKAQQDYWLEKAQNGDFIVAYSQTELGHGSNVRGLETTATFNEATQEFDVHSPTLTSMKVRTGRLALTCEFSL
jgi:acyl-CoA oxidase